MENNLKEIKEFIDQWKERARQYIPQAIEEYRKRKEEIDNTFDFYTQWEERKAKQRELSEEYPQYIREFAYGYSQKHREEKIEKLIELGYELNGEYDYYNVYKKSISANDLFVEVYHNLSLDYCIDVGYVYTQQDIDDLQQAFNEMMKDLEELKNYERKN